MGDLSGRCRDARAGRRSGTVLASWAGVMASAPLAAPLAALLALGVLLAGGGARVEAEEYSAYSDPDKTALAVILSEESNVEEFREEFGLDDAEVARALDVVREENRKVAAEFAESERIVAANRGLTDERVAEKISASGYEEAVEAAIAGTKDGISDLVSEGGGEEEELRAWVDGQWREEAAASAEGSSGRIVGSGRSRALVCQKIFATQYRGFTRFEAALPHRQLKFGDRPEVAISRGNRAVRPRVKEVGPWNTRDNYWRKGRQRSMWKDLRRCVPEARAAYFNNYNNGRDEFGRKVTNPAGVDLTPTAARRLGLDRYQNAYVSVRFPFVRR